MTPAVHRAFAVAAVLAVVAAVVAGIAIVGSPGARRRERMDERRVRDLMDLHYAVQDLVRDPDRRGSLKRALPATLAEAAARATWRLPSLADPETGEAYRYEVTGPTTYRLGATFSGERRSDHRPFWNHPPGPHAFEIDALDPP